MNEHPIFVKMVTGFSTDPLEAKTTWQQLQGGGRLISWEQSMGEPLVSGHPQFWKGHSYWSWRLASLFALVFHRIPLSEPGPTIGSFP